MRIIRQTVEGAVHHVIARFIDREFLINDDRSRQRYLDLLGRAMARSDWRCLAFAVMSNHIHLAMIGGETPPERWLRRVHPPFALWMNQRLERIGPLFAGDTAIWLIRPENVRRLVAYIHNNPVRAGVVSHARASWWTSHRAYLGEMQFPWLDVAAGLELLRLTTSELDAFVDSDIGYAPEQGALDGIHRAARKHGRLEVGTPTAGAGTRAPLVTRHFAKLKPDPRRVLQVVGEVTGVPYDALCSRDRRGSTIHGRVVAIQCGRELGLSISAMTTALGLSPQRGSQLASRELGDLAAAVARVICNRIEGELERALRNWKGS